MNDKFDELAKGLAQSVTRRGALKKFGVGLVGIALASLGLATNAQARPPYQCDCSSPLLGCERYLGKGNLKACLKYCSGCLQP